MNIYKHISLTLKALRRERGWSLDKAAEETGVSKAMLGQIEREESSPTIATLWKIASGFNTSFSSFIAENDSVNIKEPMHRTGEAKLLHPTDERIRVLPLFPFESDLNFEIYKIELLPGCEHLSPPHQHGVIEHVLVAYGNMEVLIDNIWHPLMQGEGLRFVASQTHGYRNPTAEMACIYDIIHYKNNNHKKLRLNPNLNPDSPSLI